MELNEKSSLEIEPQPPPTDKRWWKSTGIRFMVLAGIAQVIIFTAISILPDFFPSEAQKKGASPIEFGLIIGICYLGLAAFSLPWGLVTAKFSSKMQMVFSIMCVGIFTFIFGFVDRFPSGGAYLASTFSLRIVIGLACCIFQVATYTMLPVVLVGRESTGFAVMEMGVGLGYILGPAVGGAFFDLGGFYVPFLVMTISLFIIGILCLSFIEDPEIKPATESISWKKFLFCPCALLYNVIIFSTETDFGFLAVTLEPFLAQFSLSHFAIGGVILCSGLAYALTTPVWGYFCDKGKSAEYGAFAGTVLASIAFLFLGPVPWFPFEPSLWLIILTVLCCGLAVAAKMVCSFKMLMHSALNICKFPDNMATYAAVSSMFTLVVSIGGFTGPFVGGVLLDAMGMRRGTVVMFFWEVFLVSLQGLYIIHQKCRTTSEHVPGPSTPLVDKP